MDAIHDTRKPGTSRVEVAFIKYYARINGVDTLLTSDEYDTRRACGGLWSRNPFYKQQLSDTMPAQFDQTNGSLIVCPSDQPNAVFHWWNCLYPRVTIPANAERTWAVAQVRIHGPALVGLGIDYWRTPTAPDGNNIEAAVSPWFFEAPGWQNMTATEP